MLLSNNPALKHKVDLMNLAEELGNVPKAVCEVNSPKI
jgi:hypothetical protein